MALTTSYSRSDGSIFKINGFTTGDQITPDVLGLSNGGFIAPYRSPTNWHISDTGDYDGNGKTDIAWRNNNGSVSIWDNGVIGGAHIIAGPGVVPNDWHIA